MTKHPIRIVISHGTGARLFEGEDERGLTIAAEERLRELLMQGAGAGIEVACRCSTTAARIRAYLAGVGHEIQTWPGSRTPARIR